MSQTIQQKWVEYFTRYAGSCLKIWNSIVGQRITHSSGWTGIVVGVKKINNSIEIEVQLTEEQRHWNSPTKRFRFGEVFTHLTLPIELEKDLKIHYWNFLKEDLIHELRNLASQYPIDQSNYNTLDEIYDRLMRMNQKIKLPEKAIQEVNGYHRTLMDRVQFSTLSEKAMSPNMTASFPLPRLNEADIQIVEEWCQLPRNTLDRTSLIETNNKDWELGRLLSARSAEKIAKAFYKKYGKKVKDISVTQVYENNNSDWKSHDLNVDGLPIDVKNSRRSQKSEDRYTEYCIPRFKRSRTDQDIVIAGVFSPYLWAFEMLDKPIEHHGDAETLFLGETTLAKQQVLKGEFSDLVDFVKPNPSSKFFLPPWIFDYPEYLYTERNKAIKELKNFTNLASLKGATFNFNLLPISITIGVDLTKILGDEALESWERGFLNRLCSRIKKYYLSLPFLFLTILEHFLDMVASSETISDFDPARYRRFLFCKESDKPLGIYDPLKTIDALINVLSILWTAESRLIRRFRVFKLKSFNILQGKSNPNESSWTTLIAYCGGRLEDGSPCGKNPLVLGESELCERRKLICPDPDCGYCCETCQRERSPTYSTHAAPTGGFKPADASETGGSDGYPPY